MVAGEEGGGRWKLQFHTVYVKVNVWNIVEIKKVKL